MFSGKTEELIRRLERVRIAHGRICLFKPTIDTRYSNTSVVTHYGREFLALPLDPGSESIEALIESAGAPAVASASVVAFDEGNFFSDKLPGLCEELVEMGKRVIVAGLDLTFAGEPFGPMPMLFALADRIDKLEAVCARCGAPATRSQRLVDGSPAPSSDDVIVVGGLGTYEARCRDCYERAENGA
ncbi:MAG: thymidine kinase [Candidatus Bipolaricaulota bacterium]|nr:MAG: thymidine kinase [Candidatus Bipolaricaulota bacterium]